MHKNHCRGLLIMAILSFISMYVLMYAMVDRLENVHPNINQFWMAGLMTAPMRVIEVLLMKSMYHDKKMNLIVIAVSVVTGILFFLLIRQQAAITDQQFLKSMIPHHAGAILMYQQAPLADAEMKELCMREHRRRAEGGDPAEAGRTTRFGACGASGCSSRRRHC